MMLSLKLTAINLQSKLYQVDWDWDLRPSSTPEIYWAPKFNKKLSFHRGTTRRAMSVEILSSAAQLYEKSHFKSIQ